ncbi:MAG: 5'-nucleotidase C-terminal domain-containing protein [Alphaproteobacteria bacterium]|nr:5'-nucleotidase C-terminal domain-containing protein [Alphaproteobacteria bacterium]
MKKLLLGAATIAVMAGTGTAARADFTLTILHLNDFHSRFESINAYDSNCSTDDEAAGKCFGGIARIKTALDQRRDALEGNNVLFLSAGDEFQGSLFYTTYKSEVVADFFNELGLDAAATGNHEFDDGPAELAAFIDRADFPILAGNFDVEANPDLAGKMEDYAVFDLGGDKVGVIGGLTVDTVDISSPGDDVTFEDAATAIQPLVDKLEAEGVNKIILLSHLGYPEDLRVAEAVKGIDVIVGGHSNTLLSNTVEGAVDTYPKMVGDTAIVSAYAYGKYLGELSVVFDDAGKLKSAEGEPILLDASIEPDEDYLARLEELKAPIEEAMAKVVGTTTKEIDGSRESCRAVECEMGNLVTDAMLAGAPEADIAITNGGGLRASIDAGEITMGEVFTVLPFQNTLATFDAKGADIVAALENGVSQVEEGAGRFPQVAGMSFTWDPKAEPGSRIGAVMVGDSPIDPEATYHVVTNNFVRTGGDGYASFAENGMNAYDGGTNLEVVVADYIKQMGGEYTPSTGGRISQAM